MMANSNAYKAFTGFGEDIREQRAQRLAANWRKRQSRGRPVDEVTRRRLQKQKDELQERFEEFELRAMAMCQRKRIRWRIAVAQLLVDDSPKDRPLRQAYRMLMREEEKIGAPAE